MEAIITFFSDFRRNDNIALNQRKYGIITVFFVFSINVCTDDSFVYKRIFRFSNCNEGAPTKRISRLPVLMWALSWKDLAMIHILKLKSVPANKYESHLGRRYTKPGLQAEKKTEHTKNTKKNIAMTDCKVTLYPA